LFFLLISGPKSLTVIKAKKIPHRIYGVNDYSSSGIVDDDSEYSITVQPEEKL